MVTDEANGNKIVGYLGMTLWDRNNPRLPYPTKGVSEFEKRRNEMLNFVYSQFDPWKEEGIDKVANLRGGCVHRDYRGRGLTQRMMEYSLDYMCRERISLALAVSTSKYSRDALEKLDFKTQFQINYSDYKLIGNTEPAFFVGKEHKGCVLFTKRI